MDFAQHHGTSTLPARPALPKDMGKVERPHHYILADFFIARRFADVGEMNRQLRQCLDTVGNVRLHGTADHS